MSEQLKHSPEKGPDSLDLSAEVEKNLKRAEKEAREAGVGKPDANELAAKVEQQAVSGKEMGLGEKDAPQPQEFGAYTEMKGQTYARSLSRIRQRLSTPEKAMSKIMHNKILDTVSNGIGKTAARPSGILGGGIFALIGSSALLYMAKKYGFEYNFLIFFMLIGGGFVLGLIAELLIKTLVKTRR